MNTNTSAALLRQYNKKLYDRKLIDTQATDGNNQIGTWSYANMYDALYDKFSGYKNFNINMWRDALKLGEQDQYFAFLEANKENQLSDQFYDDNYYDYETMMLEMYLPFANTENSDEMRATEVFDPLTNEWVEQEIGKMSDRQYIQYQLDSARARREAEIQRQLEQEEKDNMSFWETLGHDFLAGFAEFGEGILSATAGVLDFVVAPFYATGQAIFDGDNFFDAYVDYFGDKGLTALEKQYVREGLDLHERKYTHFRDIDGNYTSVGKYFATIPNAIGMMVPSILANLATGGAYSIVGSATFYTGMFSNSMYEVANNEYVKDSPSLLKIGNVAVKTAVEAVIEYGLGKILGGTVQNNLLGISGKKNFSLKGMTKWTGMKYIGKSALQEGFEEFLQDYSTHLVNVFTDVVYEGYGNDGVTIQTLIDSFVSGTLVSLVMSGAQITASAAKSGVVNAQARKDGTYNKELGYGPGDVVIETEKGIQKLTGANKLYFSQILSDFRSAVEELKKAKFNAKKNIALAQEIYGALNSIAQFYSSFSKERIEACEMLLDRVVKSEERYLLEHERAFSILTENTKEKILTNKDTTKEIGEMTQTSSRTLAQVIDFTFSEMVGDIGSRKAKQKVHDAAKNVEEKLTDGNVTQVKSAINIEGKTFSKDPEVSQLEKQIGKEGVTRLQELSKEYDWVFVTDGHTAAEDGDILFVSEGWLKNYETSDIYKFLNQSEVIKTLLTWKEYIPMWKKVTAFYREFSGQTNAKGEEALLQLLFNKNVYQKFLLSNTGENAHEFRKFIFHLYDTVNGLIDVSGGVMWQGKVAKKRVNLVNDIREQMKLAMREPILKAIINWGFEPQNIRAMSVLTKRDQELITEYKKHKEVFGKLLTTKMTSAYQHLIDDIIKGADFNNEELEIIKRVRDDKGTQRERIIAYALLNFADQSTDAYSIDPMTRDFKEFYNTAFSPDLSLGSSADLFVTILSELTEKYSAENWPESYLEKLQNISDKIIAFNEHGATDVDYGKLLLEARDLVNVMYNIRYNSVEDKIQNHRYGTFTIPVEAFSSEENNADRVQFISDKLNEFKERYGISAKQMILSDLTGMSIEQRDILSQDMELVGVDDVVSFVCRKLELLLGEKFSVIPVRHDWTGFSLSRTYKSIRRHTQWIYDEYVQKSRENRKGIMVVRDMINNLIRDLHYYAQELKNSKLLAIEQSLRDVPTIDDQIDILTEELLPLFEELPEEFVGFTVADKVPADKLLSSELVSDVNDEDFNGIFLHLFNKPGIDAETGEVIDVELVDKYGKYMYQEDKSIFLLDFLSTELPGGLKEKLKDWKVALRLPSGDDSYYEAVTVTNEQTIYINPVSSTIRHGLVHEINHAIQYEYDLPGGFNTDIAEQMPDLLKYVWENYSPYVAYVYRQVHGEVLNDEVLEFLTEAETTDEFDDSDFEGIDDSDIYPFSIEVEKLPKSVKETLAYCAYCMIQGELFAEHFPHNESVPKSFIVRRLPGIGGQQSYVLSPDGKKKFYIDYTFSETLAKMLPTQSNSSLSPQLTESALYVTMMNVLAARQSNDSYTNTFHTRLSKDDVPILSSMIDKNKLSQFYLELPTINELIQNTDLLSDEVLSFIGNDLSEGNVAARLKEYIEEKFPGTSIDREGNTHRYVLVDDNAYDDLMLHSVQNAASDDSVSLYEANNSTDGVSLSKFYKPGELRRLGVGDDVKVIINPNVNTETVFDRGFEQGIIYIRADNNTTNAQLLDKINHEFRHLMQRYNLFETGFTPDFNVTNEMISDVKKHVPELFKDKNLKEWAVKDAKNKKQSWEASIVQQFVYTLTGGELNAYGISSSLVSGKTIYATYEAGKPTIFMPWYDAKTGEGRHRTDFLAARADDVESIKGISFKNMPKVRKKPKDTRPKAFSHKKAKGTNLEYFVKKGTRNQLDPALQDFVIATTGNENRLPPELMMFINGKFSGTLTRQAFNKWFRNVKEINEFTFKLINKHIFKNDYINSLEELDSFLSWQPQVYWALNILLLKKGASLQTLVTENSLDNFMSFMRSAEGSKLWEEVLKLSENFDKYRIESKNTDEVRYEHIGIDEKLHSYMRVLAMNYFDGTLGGAFYTANAFRKTLFRQEDERRNPKKFTSLDQKINDENSDDKEMTLLQKISEEDVNTDGDDSSLYGNDILAIYEAMRSDTESSINYILYAKYRNDVEKLVNSLDKPEGAKRQIRERLNDIEDIQKELEELEKKTERTEKEELRLKNYVYIIKQYRKLIKDRPIFHKALMDMDTNEIAARIAIIMEADNMDMPVNESVFDTSKKFAHQYSEAAKSKIAEEEKSTLRVNVVARIKGRASTILNFIDNKIISFEDLPQEVQDMFEEATGIDEKTKRKFTQRKLKREVYSVGRGRVKLPGLTDTSRKDYSPKHNIFAGNEEYRHSTDELLKNERILVATVKEIRNLIKEQKAEQKIKEKAEKDSEKRLKSLERQNVELRDKLKNATEEIRQKNLSVKRIEITTNKKKKVSDTPNNFQIISTIEMPEILYDIYDVSFNELADTRVQFVSKDKDGKYYDKETMKEKDFDSVVKHEVANWEAFFEATSPKLLSLTRSDVLNIVEFIELGVATIGPSNKLSAFNIFLLGYFIDAARSNAFDWYFSEAEISHIEKLFENRASEAGIVLNSVKQMRETIDPLKRVRQRMFDDWISLSDTDKDELTKEVDSLQNEKDLSVMKEKAEALSEKLKEMQKAEFEARNKSTIKFWKKGFWQKDNLSKLYQEVKSFRYMSMLSSPLTWIRNKISNVVTFTLNKSADVVAKIIFLPKGYRKEQWELSNVKISQEVKAFIDTYIKENPVFDPLYDMSGKYDERQRKKINSEKELFVSLITSAIEQKYAANHRFDRNVFNRISTFINNRMSDKSFIKLVTGRYFGKILTLEVAKGNVDLSKGLSNNALNLFAEAVIMANQEYMHKRSFLADSIDKFAGEHPNFYEAISWFQPFLNSSFNWFLETLKYTPFGLINSIYRMTRLEQQIDKIDKLRADGRELVTDSRVTEYLIRRDIGKGTVGLILSLLGLLLALNGILEFEEEDEKIYVITGDTKVDISNIFASSSVLIGASIAQHWVKQSDGDVMSWENMLDNTVGYMFDGFFINDILERHRWDTGIYEGVLTETESVLRSFVPQMWQLTVRSFNNEKIKYSSGMKGMWERWLNSFIPGQPLGNRKVNPYTGEVQTKYAIPILGELLKGGLIGPQIYYYEIDETERMCRDLGVNKNELTGELTITLKDGTKKKFSLEKDSLNEYYGSLNKASLEKIKSQKHTVEMPDGTFKTLSWDKMNDEQHARVINRTMTNNAEIAKIYIWTQSMKHKYYASDSLWSDLRKLGITQNVYKGDRDFVE